MKRDSFLLRLLLEWVLICAGVLCSLYCLTTAFSLTMPTAVLILVPILALAFCLLFNGKVGKFYALGVLGLLLLLAWLLRAELVEGFRNLWGTLGSIFARGYDLVRDYLPQEETSPEDIGPALVSLAVLQTYVCALSVRLWKRTAPVGLMLLLSIAPCFILLDTHPSLLPLLTAVFVVLALSFSQSSRRRETGDASKAILLSALLSVAVLGLLLLIFPQKTYSPPITWNELTSKLSRWEQAQNIRGNTNAGLAGNPDEIDLETLGSLPNRPITALYVTSTKESYLYLRGSSYMSFDGKLWTRGEVWEGDGRAAYPYLGKPGEAVLSIETYNTERALFTAYQIVELPGGSVYSDAYVQNTEEVDSYSMRFTLDPDPVTPDETYNAWVYAHCLEVPEQTRNAVLAWWKQVDGRDAPTERVTTVVTGDESLILSEPLDPVKTEAFAQSVAAQVSQTARYSRNPPRVPVGRDFCDWFLNDAEEGYCVHYATACTALLRSLGIPARYVSGYVSSVPANRRTELTVLQAHAWVEIWSGGRWVVVEPTPDDATEFTGRIPLGGETQPETTNSPVPPPSEELTDPPPIVSPHETESGEHRLPDSTETEETHASGPSKTPEKKVDMTGYWIFLGLVSFVGLVLVRRILILKLRQRRIRRARGNARARLLYRYLVRLHKLGNNPVPPEATEIAKKAAFSQHELDEEELIRMRQFYDKQRYLLQYYGFWKRVWCRYVLAVI